MPSFVSGAASFSETACSCGNDTANQNLLLQAWKHPECGFDQEAQRRCMLAAVLLPLAGLTVPAAKGKPVRCARAWLEVGGVA